MKSILKKLLRGILKLIVLATITFMIPGSILLALEFVSRKLGVFPLYTVSAISLAWVCFLMIPFILARGEKNSERLNQPEVRNAKLKTPWRSTFQPVWGFASTVLNSTKRVASNLKFPIPLKFNPISSSNLRKTTTGSSTKREPIPVGILLIINRKQARPKAAAASGN